MRKPNAYWSTRAFRISKRSEIRDVLASCRALRIGCAYTPAYKNIVAAIGLLEKAKELMNVRNWKR